MTISIQSDKWNSQSLVRPTWTRHYTMHAAQLQQQRRIEILYHKFPEIFRGIIPEKYRYFSGKIPRKFPEISELTTLIMTMFFACYKYSYLLTYPWAEQGEIWQGGAYRIGAERFSLPNFTLIGATCRHLRGEKPKKLARPSQVYTKLLCRCREWVGRFNPILQRAVVYA